MAENIYYTYIYVTIVHCLQKQLVCAHHGGGGGEGTSPKTCTQLPPKRKREEKERKNKVGPGSIIYYNCVVYVCL